MAQKAATRRSSARGKSAPGAKSKTTSGKQSKRPTRSLSLPSFTLDTAIDGVGLVCAIAGVLTGLAMIPSGQPSMAQPWLDLLARLFGVLAFAAPIALMAFGFWLMARRFVNAPAPPWYRILGGLFVAVALFGALGFLQQWREPASQGGYGGLIGLGVARALRLAVGRIGGVVALLVMGTLGLLFLFELSLADVGRALARLRPSRPSPAAAPSAGVAGGRRAVQLPLPAFPDVLERTLHWWRQVRDRLAPHPKAPPATSAPASRATSPPGESPVASDGVWQLPPWRGLLEDRVEISAADEDIRRKTHLIEETLSHFGVPARVVEINRGPTVTQFGVEPGFVRKRVRGQERELKVKVSAITNLHNDLALALAAPSLRIEAPVPGQSYVGIEVPNDRADAVTLRGAMESEEFASLDGALRVALGRDVMGAVVTADLAKMPHLLIAGATGSGKSVCINAILCNLLCNHTPDQLKLLLVDPKTVELIGYNGVPHLIVPVVTDIERVVGLLRWSVNEMERRYKLFSQEHVRHLQGYNAKMSRRGERTLPYLVLVIDELADLMMAAADQVEGMICRLAQMARATGIHLILATQRPSVDVVTGLIKANFPARIAFAVTSQVDSRVILDRPGAEALLGRGDMLYMASDSGILRRAQGCFVGDHELERINQFWIRQAEAVRERASTAPKKQASEAVPAVQAVRWDELLADDGGSGEEDELLPKARELVAKAGNASISMLQRRLRVGYARAARLVDLLEAEGTIGSSEGPGKMREVFVGEAEPGSDGDPGWDPAWVDED